MKTNRSRWIGLAVAGVAVVVIWIWLFGPGRREEGEEEERVTATTPILSHGPNGEIIVALSADEQAATGLKSEALAPVTFSRKFIAYGVVLDPAPLAALDAQLVSARAALDASRAEYARAKLLHSENENISLKDVQAADARFRGDQSQFDLLNQRLTSEWGGVIAAMTPAARAQLIDALMKRAAGVVRVSLPPGQLMEHDPVHAQIAVFGYGASPLAAGSIWHAPTVDPHFQGQGFLLWVEARGFALPPVLAVTAFLESPAAPERGVVVPRAAIVRMRNSAWAYVHIAPTRFARREVAWSAPTAGGWFVTTGVARGDRVVVTGAQALLSEEFKSQIQVQD